MAKQSKPPKGIDYEGKSADQIYADLVSRAGLYGKAFFGHKASKAERRELNRLWERALRLANPTRPVEPAGDDKFSESDLAEGENEDQPNSEAALREQELHDEAKALGAEGITE